MRTWSWEQGITRFYLPPNPIFSALKAMVGAQVTIWVCSGNHMRKFRLALLPQLGDGYIGMVKLDTNNGPQISTPTHHSAQADFEFPFTVVCGISYRPHTQVEY